MNRSWRRPQLAAWAGRLWPLLAAVPAAGLPALLAPYPLSQATRVLAVGVLAVSVAVLTGHAGLATLGQVFPFAVGAYTTGLLGRAEIAAGPVQLAAAAAAAGVVSLVVGVAVVRTRALTFLMVTLAVGVLAATVAGQWRQVTGGTDGLFGIPTARLWPGGTPLLEPAHRYWYVLTVTAAAITVTVLLLRSPAGMLLRGVRDHEPRMRASGHRVGAYLLAAYTAAGVLAGVAGHLLVTAQRFVSPGDVGFAVAALVLLAVIIGGTGSVGGALAAAAVVLWVRDWAAAVVPGYGLLVLGGLFVTVVYLLPDGITPPLGRAARAAPRLVVAAATGRPPHGRDRTNGGRP